LISATGLTGQRQSFAANLKSIVARVRRYSSLPIAVGFGISSAEQAAKIAKIADGVIVGSVIVDLLAKKKTKQALKLVAAMRQVLDVNR